MTQDTHPALQAAVAPPLPRQRILVVGQLPWPRPVLESLGTVELAGGWADAVDRVQQGIASGDPCVLLLAVVSAPADLGTCELLSRLQDLDHSLHAILGAAGGEPVRQGYHKLLAFPQRCLLLPASSDPFTLTQMVTLLLHKARSEAALHRSEAELVMLNGRRSVEMANTHADLIQLNHKLEAARDAAESANRAKSAFLATMSHEIRTPMTAMLGFADYLLDEGDIRQAPRERIEAINTIVRNGRHLLQLINDILDLSKIEANRVELERIVCRPAALIADVVSLMRGRADAKKLQLQVSTDGPIPEEIQSDPTRLRQILVNVIGNAIKFTEQGCVRIVVGYVAQNNSPLLQFKVSDTGIGMTPEQIGRLFQPFSQADMSMTRRYGGSGLGLCISQRFAELLGGRIDVSSQPGQGTTFCISVSIGDVPGLRLVSYETLRDKTDEDPYAVAEARRLQLDISGRVLVAEDGPDNQRLFAHLLRKAGATVTLVDNGELACQEVAAAELRGEPYDVVLMDMQMPVLDGYAAATRLRASGSELPIVALTAFAMTGDREKCLQAGCSDYVTKPIDRKVFLPTVAKYVLESQSRRAAINGQQSTL